MEHNAFYAQSGGVTAVINASAAGVIETAKKYPEKIKTVYAGIDGILGALTEDMIDVYLESEKTIAALKHTPSGAFGSCRYKLKSPTEHAAQYQRLMDVFKAHDIRYFFYNGGGDSQDTSNKISQLSARMGFPITCIGVPKTIDNDLPFTDCCPGFGSVAKYAAVSILEASFDVASMCRTSTKVFVMEVMGRNAGWIAAATGLAKDHRGLGPDIILFPEVALDEEKFLQRVEKTVTERGFCIVALSEGIKNTRGEFLSAAGTTDAFGHAQLGGAASVIVDLIKRKLNIKCHWAICDYLQRSARHIASRTDVEQAYSLGKAAVDLAMQGKNAVMPIIKRTAHSPYTWEIDSVSLNEVANVERKMPAEFISEDGFFITPACREYLTPLIEGEDYPPYENGLPAYALLQKFSVQKKLPPFSLDQ